ncbi:TEX36 protein, partial [Ceuthmochares aereus]|nr:TEX36 protein [Ceuthmochares aereus]
FAHAGASESQHESTTSSALKQVQNSRAAQCAEDSLSLTYGAREQSAANNNFPFSAHDNRHSLQNIGEYFDFVSI